MPAARARSCTTGAKAAALRRDLATQCCVLTARVWKATIHRDGARSRPKEVTMADALDGRQFDGIVLECGKTAGDADSLIFNERALSLDRVRSLRVRRRRL